MLALTEPAAAKVNLTLHITGTRPDGYHLLDSLIVFTEHGDRVHLEPSQELALDITGPYGPALAKEETARNLAFRAARAFQGACKTDAGARLTLEKHIPVGAGLGGGSADAAAVLRGLQRLWQIALPAETLHTLALSLGADVPVCLTCLPSRVRGIGEEISPVGEVPEAWLLLVNPGVPLATAHVFQAYRAEETRYAKPCEPPDSGWRDASALADWLGTQANDLETAAIRLIPEIGSLLGALRDSPGCLLARMTGSGATCFGVFADKESATRASEILGQHQPGWWRQVTRAGTPITQRKT